MTGAFRLAAISGLLLFFAACEKGQPARTNQPVALPTLKLSELTADQQSAFACAEGYRKEDTALASALPTEVSRWAKVQGEPPQWRSGGEWCVGFVDKDLADAPRENVRDGCFAIVVRANPCELLYKLVPGGCLPAKR
jgi:hypothetical protein